MKVTIIKEYMLDMGRNTCKAHDGANHFVLRENRL